MPKRKSPKYRPIPEINRNIRTERKQPEPFKIIRTEDIVLSSPDFRLIPPFTRGNSYEVDSGWSYVDNWLGDVDGIIFDENPDFQRQHVWTEKQQIDYIEFILREGRSSNDIYWNCSTWGEGYSTPVVLVDGKQRLEAVRRFIHNEIKIFGFYYKDFIPKILPLHARFRMHINNLKSKAEVLTWYLLLNRGGTPHTDEEIDRIEAMLKEELKNA